jgi:hypothetical protein
MGQSMEQTHEQNKAAALSEILNLLEQAQQDRLLRRISLEQIQIIAGTYEVNLQRAFPDTLAGFYKDYLQHCLEDKIISEAESETLAHLKLILGLNDYTIDQIHNDVVHSIYQAGVDEVLADGRLDPEELEFLTKLQHDLIVPGELAKRIYTHKAEEYLQKFFLYAIADERLSPDEDEELYAIARSLGVDLDLDQQTQSALNKYRLYWMIENGKLPEIEVDFPLQHAEDCYLICNADWYEYSTKTLRERMSSVRFFKSAYQHLTDLNVKLISDDDMVKIDSGRAILTSQRLILDGGSKRAEIDLEKIIDLTTYRNGVEIVGRSGTSPFLALKAGADIFAVMLGRAIRDL